MTGDLSDTRTRYLGSRPVKLFRISMQGSEAVSTRNKCYMNYFPRNVRPLYLSQWNFPLLSIGKVHFLFKSCWVVIFIFIQFSIEHSCLENNWVTASKKSYVCCIYSRLITHLINSIEQWLKALLSKLNIFTLKTGTDNS